MGHYLIALVFMLGTAEATSHPRPAGMIGARCRDDRSCDEGLECTSYEYTSILCTEEVRWFCEVAPDLGVSQ